MPFFTRRVVSFDGTSASSSSYTSHPLLAADYDKVSFSVVTAAASASTVTVQGSNDDGLSAAIAEGSWSALTAFPTALATEMFNIDPGARWIRFQRDSVDSQLSITAQFGRS